MTKPLVVAVWKEKLTRAESVAVAKQIQRAVRPEQWPFEIGIAPNPFSYVAVKEVLTSPKIKVVAQNILWEAASGSYIGEVTASMLREVGCDYVIVGHSERRRYFKEDDAVIARKVSSAIVAGAKPILCFGDDREQKESGKTQDVLKSQLGAAFDEFDELPRQDLVLAYEPVWAISTWRSDRSLPSGLEIFELHQYIRGLVAELAGKDFATSVSLLYGGSVSGDNAEDYFQYEGVDGFLVGGASKTPDSFLATLRSARDGIKKR